MGVSFAEDEDVRMYIWLQSDNVDVNVDVEKGNSPYPEMSQIEQTFSWG